MTPDVDIIRNLLPQGYADQIEQDLLRPQFPWFLIDDVTSAASQESRPGLTNIVYDYRQAPTEWYAFVKPMIYQIEQATQQKIVNLLRIRVGLLLPNVTATCLQNAPHVDFNMPHKTACYYVNDSDGDTVVFNNTIHDISVKEISDATVGEYVQTASFAELGRCAPVKNTLCVFDGARFHASTYPKVTAKRIVITINYQV